MVRLCLTPSYVVKNAPDEGNVAIMTPNISFSSLSKYSITSLVLPTPWYRPRNRADLLTVFVPPLRNSFLYSGDCRRVLIVSRGSACCSRGEPMRGTSLG
jgi:hypothetical protein